MQEEVEQKVVSLIVDCGKLGEQELKKALAMNRPSKNGQ